MLSAVLLVGFALLGIALWQSANSVEETFQEALERAPGCTVVSDCDVLYTQCPLGCSHPVAKQAIPSLTALADKLVDQHRRYAKECAYDCDHPPPLLCESGRCTFADESMSQ